jgi:DNA-binding transcriptional ArsR family regulator
MVKQPGLPAREEDLEQLSNLLRLLSDKTRLNILLMLSGGERNVTSLCDALKLPQPTVSHHLGLLRMSNIITGRRDGKQVFYGLDGRVNTQNSCLEIGAGQYSICIDEGNPSTISA